MQTIESIMHAQPETVTKNETLKNAASKMERSNIGFLPVIDENQKVVGTLTDRDITLAIGKNTKGPQDIKVNEAMNPEIYTISPGEDAAAALKLMRTKQVGRLPVVDGENRLKGVITLTGIAKKVNKGNDQKELEYNGKENILNTLRSIAGRNKKETIEEPAEE